jgi:hypothetical protein
MNFPSAVFVLTASTLLLTNCGGSAGPQYSYQNVTITVTPQITSLPINGSQTFTATVTNAPPDQISWLLAGGSPIAGNFSTGNGWQVSGTSVTYTAPSAPPIINPNDAGVVHIYASVPNAPPGGAWTSAQASVNIAILGPVSVGISPATASLQLGTARFFSGYAAGSTNKSLSWQVNGIAGGGTATGTIDATGRYMAPTVMPMTGNTVTVTAVSQADPTKSASATVTLTQ